MESFDKVYGGLNIEQKTAVDTIYGPVLVIAGPGTGKTQLLSARVANILRQTDTSPSNILCLTFTENGAENMRERLASFIGAKAAYEVEISTYHGFGNSLLSQGRDFIDDERTSIDELQQFQIIQKIKQNLPSTNLLYPSKNTVKSILNVINDIKQENISPEIFEKIVKQNIKLIKKSEKYLKSLDALVGVKQSKNESGTKKSAKDQKIEAFFELYKNLKDADEARAQKNTPTFLEKIYTSFEEQSIKYDNDPKKSIQHFTRDWQNKYFSKNDSDEYKFSDEFASRKALDIAEVYYLYESELKLSTQQDFNDMILRAINLLEAKPDFKFSMQEKYQFILLDEYQDTNGAQSRIVELLTKNELLPDLIPNVLAVGDDDQAIMAFQGAKFSNMQDFANFYGDETKIINLTKNYRSHQKILDFAHNIADQIDGRLSNIFSNLDKQIYQENNSITDIEIWRKSFKHQSTEFNEVAEKINTLINSGVQPSDIAILAPKHSILEEIAKYLNHLDIPIDYEKSENILEEAPVQQVIEMLKLAQDISEGSYNQNAGWARVLSFDFWQLKPLDIYKEISKFNKWDESSPNLTDILVESENQEIKNIVEFFIDISQKINDEKFETIIDYIVGSKQLQPIKKSPMREYYQAKSDEDFYNLALYMTILRGKFQSSNQDNYSKILTKDFLQMIQLYEESEIKILSKNPFSANNNSVKIMTAFSAKGLEFSHTFLVSVDDSAWGVSKGNSQTISLPKNLERIKDPNQEDTKKRLFFVAITRAKTHLYLTSSENSFDNKTRRPLKFLEENIEAGIVETIPEGFNEIRVENIKHPDLEILELNWNDKFSPEKLTNEQIFIEKIQNFVQSASSLTSFYDLQYGGPKKFFENYILKFPQEVSGSARFGTVMHEVFDFWQRQKNNNSQPTLEEIINEINKRIDKLKISEREKINEKTRAEIAFTNFYNQRRNIFKTPAKSEVKFRKIMLDNGILIDGNIDRIEINDEDKTIEIVDFKTGNISQKDSFKNKTKLHKYEIQLYFYKLLLNNSPEYAKYKVNTGRLEFIEGDERYKTPIIKSLNFNQESEDRVKQLIAALDKKLKAFDFKNIENLPNVTVSDLIKFENQIIDETQR